MKNTLLISFCLFFSGLSHAQLKVADNFFKNYAYSQATELYLEVLKKEDTTVHVLSRLGDCFYNNSNVKSANYWYEKAVNNYNDINPEYLYKYIQTLRSLNKFKEAQTWTRIFKARKKDDKRFKENFDIENFEALESTERVYVDVENLNINSEYADFGGFEKNGLLYFASSRVNDTITDTKKIYQWNKEPFLDIHQAKVKTTSTKKTINYLKSSALKNINTNLHEASVAITKDGKTLYFTRDNLNKKNKVAYDKKGTSNLRIYRATLKNGRWTNITDLPFNDDGFSSGSPALSPDNKVLYFVSDRPESIGQTDIFKVDIKEDGRFGTPENLGKKINTEGRENFPFVSKDSTFYFSSDANINLGLLDIFESNILKMKKNDTSTVYVKNLGAPFNSGFDDFAYFIDSETNTGYFSSNREGGKGGDDIYSFGKYECKQQISGITEDEISLKPIPKVVVKLLNENGKVVETTTSDDNGYYEFKDVGCEKKYTILANRVIYKPKQKPITTLKRNDEKTDVKLILSPLIIESEIVINPIFFDYNNSDIRPDAAYELENIVSVMRQTPEMIIRIEAHTDSRGRDNYNLKLSDKRAKATRDYLYSRGIAVERIPSAIGYGESQLINKCKNGVKCTNEEHQVNRRSKFIITNGFTNK